MCAFAMRTVTNYTGLCFTLTSEYRSEAFFVNSYFTANSDILSSKQLVFSCVHWNARKSRDYRLLIDPDIRCTVVSALMKEVSFFFLNLRTKAWIFVQKAVSIHRNVPYVQGTCCESRCNSHRCVLTMVLKLTLTTSYTNERKLKTWSVFSCHSFFFFNFAAYLK